MRRVVSSLVIAGGKKVSGTGRVGAMHHLPTRSFITKATTSTNHHTQLPSSKRYFSSSDSNNKSNDKELQESYQGFWPRISAMFELMEDSGRETYEKLMKGNVISRDKHLIGINLYGDLQHPLLKKYNFDAIDFVKGAQEAFSQIRRAVTSMEIKDSIHSVHAEELLKEAFNPPLFKLYMAAFREIEARDYKINLESLTIKDTTLGAVTTWIVDDDFYKEEEHTYNRLAEVLRTIATTQPNKEELNFEGIERRYEIGSVVANVDVIYDTEEVYLKIDELRQEETIHRLNRTVVRFQSCISGQNELDWVVTMMDSAELSK